MTDSIETMFGEGGGDVQLLAAVPLPNTGALSRDEAGKAISAVSSFLRLRGHKVADVARELDVPFKKLKAVLDGVIEPGDDDVIRSANMWIERTARDGLQGADPVFVDTRVAQQFKVLARLCRESLSMGLIVGESGVGKTRCAQAVHEMTVGSIYIRTTLEFASQRGMRHAIARTIGVRARAMRNALDDGLVFERTCDRLGGSHRLLIIDEAQMLKDGALGLLRDLHDIAEIPILLVGTPDLADRIEADKAHGAVLYSRFLFIRSVTRGFDASLGGRPLYTVAQIKEMFQVPQVRLTGDAADWLTDEANDLTSGSLRRAERILAMAVKLARKRQDKSATDKVSVSSTDLMAAAAAMKDREEATQTARRKTAATA